MNRRATIATLVLVGVTLLVRTDAAADLGEANTTAACCQLTTSLGMDAIRGLDDEPDERFFKGEGAPPNIHFLVDNSCSMREFPQIAGSGDIDDFWVAGPDTDGDGDNDGNGCSNTRLLAVQASKSWDPNKNYNPLNPANLYQPIDVGTGLGSDTGYPNLFLPTKIYRFMTWRDSTSPASAYNDIPTACAGFHNPATAAVAYNACVTCMQQKGFYKKPNAAVPAFGSIADYYVSNDFVFTGAFLNFNPPKAVQLRWTMKTVVRDLRRVRAAISVFNTSDEGAVLTHGLNPPCDQSLNGANWDSNRASYINDINGIAFNTNTPLAESLLNIGQLYSSSNNVYQNDFGFSSTGTAGVNKYAFPNSYRNGALNSQLRSWCWGCQISSVIVLTDGQPTVDDNVPATKISAKNGGAVACPDNSGPAGVPDGNPDCPDTGNWKLDDVAKLLHGNDLQKNTPVQVGDFNTAGQQSAIVYTVGFGEAFTASDATLWTQNPIMAQGRALLQNTARVGDGEFYGASDGDQLRDAIWTIVAAIQTRATSFSAAAVSSLQVTRTSGSVLPRFKPSKAGSEKPWQGFLYRYELASERVTSYGGNYCDPELAASILDGGTGDPNDLNQDGDCSDLNLVDSESDPVIEDDDGNFVKRDAPTTAAVPYWEAGATLKGSSPDAGTVWSQRSIWTVVDSNGDNKIDYQDTPVEFTAANAATLRPYLGLGNTATECAELAALQGVASLTPTQCAAAIIRYYRGADEFNDDPALRSYDRSFLLHDIFHSSPVIVEPPSSKASCGFGTQCQDSLFRTDTPLKTDYGTTSSPRDAYEEYVQLYGHRKKIILVGSNGGMLHAFDNGSYVSEDTLTHLPIFNQGTGRELWAFVPPDLLPRLRAAIDKHRYLVDGTAMVRDAWIDGMPNAAPTSGSSEVPSSDNRKQVSEYRTLAVMGEGIGGVHRFAIDITDTDAMADPFTNPTEASAFWTTGRFRWMWPQPCDHREALAVGFSFGNFAPRPPPIGAVALRKDSLGASAPIKFNVPGESDPVPAIERWVAVFNGGWDKFLARGRGLAMVDLRDGRTLWSYFHNAATGHPPNTDKLTTPILASPSLIDLGEGNSLKQNVDGLFDTATVGDFDGNVWLFRMWEPGKGTSCDITDPTATTCRVSNWYGARAFRTTPPTGSTVHHGIAYMTTNIFDTETGYLRTYVGTGDRFTLTDPAAGVCRLSNPKSCALMGCGVSITETVSRGATAAASHSLQLTNNATTAATYNTSANSYVATPGNACTSAGATLGWTITPSASGSGARCTTSSTGTVTSTCSMVSGKWTCTNNAAANWASLKTAYNGTLSASPAAFYGFWSYGMRGYRTFRTAAEANAYDIAYGGSAPGVGGTRPMSDAELVTLSGTGGGGSALGAGWKWPYPLVDERTGSGSGILDGCIVWSSFEPVGSSGALCATTGVNNSYVYNAHFITGAAGCAKSFTAPLTRSSRRTAIAPPNDPVVLYTVGKSVTTGFGMINVGNIEGFNVSEGNDLVRSVFQLEVDRQTHDCRHGGQGCP